MMNRICTFGALTLALLTAGVWPALAQSTPALPVISIQQVNAPDATTYAMWIARSNEAIKELLGTERYFRVYVGEAAGDDSGAIFAVSGAESFATLSKNWETIMAQPAATQNRASMEAIRTLGPASRLKAMRFEGTSATGWLYNTQVMVNDEAGYLKALDGLRVLFDSHEMKDCKINVYRVVAGRQKYSHLVSINAPSAERLAAVLDAVTAPWMAAWFAESAGFRTVVKNGTYREITR